MKVWKIEVFHISNIETLGLINAMKTLHMVYFTDYSFIYQYCKQNVFLYMIKVLHVKTVEW